MNGLRAEARQRFEAEQQFTQGENLQRTAISLVTIAKFLNSETTIRQTSVQWPGYLDICDLINSPVFDNVNEKATATMNIVKFRRDSEGILSIDRPAFMNLFKDLGFNPYWLNLILSSTYGFFSQHQPGSTLYRCYLHTVSYTLLWTYNSDTVTTKVLFTPREHSQYPQQIFRSFLSTLVHHKDLINDWRFCSFLCGIELVRWIEGTAGENLGRIRDIEIVTGHGAWHEAQSDAAPSTDQLVYESKRLGLVLTALANVIRHACIVRMVLSDLVVHRPCLIHQTSPAQTPSAATSTSILSDITDAVALLEGQIQSGELQASYLQERGRMQQSVIFNLLTRHDAKSSKEIALAAQRDSYSMKTIAIMTMVFLPPTFFATLFAMPLLDWNGPKVVQPKFGIFWVFSLPTIVLVFLIWHLMSSDKTVFAKARVWIENKRHEDKGNADLEKSTGVSQPFRWNGLRYRSER
ncbi:unnamed protein product [Alternaria alternata]